MGKFAHSIQLDRCWPKKDNDYVQFRGHVRTFHHNSTYAFRVIAFETAWDEYQAYLLSEEEAPQQVATAVAATSKTVENSVRPLITSKTSMKQRAES